MNTNEMNSPFLPSYETRKRLITPRTSGRLSSRLAAIAFLFMGSLSSQAGTVYWDSDASGANNSTLSGTNLGGTGNWNSSTSATPLLNWWPGTGTTDQAWVNANNNTAVFWGTAGTVSLTDAITVGGLQFNTTGYSINTGANTLTFANGSVITLNNIAAATITGAVTGSGSMAITSSGSTAGVLTLNGTSAGGWSGATTISNGATLALSGSNQALLNTSAIALGGSITLTSTNAGEAALDRISNTATITSTGGIFTVNDTAGAAGAYSETTGTLALASGLLNIVATNANTGGTEVLALSGLTHSGTSTVAFSAGGGLNTTTNRINVAGATATTAGQIIGPWATVGASSGAQTDYAVYDASGNVLAANIAASAETTWTNAASSYTLSSGATLSGSRTMTSLRYTGGTGALALGGNNLQTDGILNGGSGTLTISGSGLLTQTGTAAGMVYINTGNANITISSTIANNTGALALVKTGAGTLNLSGANTYTGDTVVQEGTLLLSATTRVNGNVIVGSPGGGPAAVYGTTATNSLFNGSFTTTATVYSNGTFNFDNNGGSYLSTLNVIGGTVNAQAVYLLNTINMTGGSILGTTLNGTITAVNTTASASTANIATGIGVSTSITFNIARGSSAVDLNFSGVYAQYYSDGITKTGAGVLELSGANTVSGTTTISSGTILLSNSMALQNSPLANGGTGIVFDSAVATHAFQIGGLNGSGNLALQDNASTPNAITLTLAPLTNTSYSGTLSGAGSLIKTGTFNQTLSGSDTFTGSVSITNGKLTVANVATGVTSQALGEGNTVTLGVASTSSGNLIYTGAGGTLDKNISALGNGGDTIQNTGGGLLTLSGTLTKANTVLTLSSGSFNVTGQITGGGTNSFNSDFDVNNATVTVSATNNNYTGPTLVYGGGTLLDGTSNALPAGTVLTTGSTSDGAVTNTYNLSGFNQSIAALNSVSSGSNVNIVTNTGTSTLTLTGTNSDNTIVSGSFGGSIGDGSGKTSLTVGGGTQTLGGSNGYTGNTTISSGTLALISASSNNIASSAQIIVGTGTGSSAGLNATGISGGFVVPVAQTLSGFGTVTGATTVNGSLTPGTGTGGAVLTFASGLTIGNGANLHFGLGSTGDLVAVTGSLTLSGSAILNFSPSGTLVTGTAYDLFTYATGSLTGAGNLSTWSLGTGTNPAGTTGETFGTVSLGGGTSAITVTFNSSVANAYWTGSQDTSWNTLNSGSSNFNTSLAGGTNAGALPGAATNVFFTTSSPTAAHLTTTTGTNFTINSLTFNASGSAAVSISGNTLTINATGTNSNTSGNGITVASGAASGNSISSNVALGASQTWTVTDAGNTLTVGGVVSDGTNGAANLTKSGSGVLVLSGSNTYSGTTTVSAGALVAGGNAPSGSAGVLGNSTSAIQLGDSNSGSTPISLLANGAFTVGRPITVNNFGGTITIGGSLTSGTAIYGGNIILSKGVTLTASAGGTVDFKTGTWSTGNNAIIIGSIGNTGTVILDNALSTSGGITLSYGTLTLNSAFTGGAMTVSAGATLSGSGSVALTTGVTSGTVNGNGLTLTGAATFNGAGNTLSGQETATAGVTVAAGASLTQTGTLAGNISLANGASTSLTGGGTVGTVTLNGGGDTISGNPTLTATSGISVNGTNNTIASGTISGNATQAASSALAVNGTLSGSDTLNGSASLSGGGNITGGVNLTGNNDTVSGNNTLTVGTLNVSGTGNQISSGTVNATGGTTVTGATAGNASLQVNGTLNGGATVSATGSGNGTIGGSGKVNGGITVSAGGSTYPSMGGASATKLLTDQATYNTGGMAQFQVVNAIGSGSSANNAAGNYDQIAVTGGGTPALDIGSGSTLSQIQSSGSSNSGVTLQLNMSGGTFGTLQANKATASNPYIGLGTGSSLNLNQANYFVLTLGAGTSQGLFQTLTVIEGGNTLTGTIYYSGTNDRFSTVENPGNLSVVDNGAIGDVTVENVGDTISQEFAISYVGSFTTGDTVGGHDIVLTAIPEPSTWRMILGGFGMLIGIQRLRRRRVGI